MPSLAERAKLQRQQQHQPPAKTRADALPPSWVARQGKKRVYAFVTADTKQELQFLAIKQDKTEQVLVIEALNLLFEAYNLSPIAR